MYNRHPEHCQNITKLKVWWLSQRSEIGTFKSIWRQAPSVLLQSGEQQLWRCQAIAGVTVSLYIPHAGGRAPGFRAYHPFRQQWPWFMGHQGRVTQWAKWEELSSDRCCHVSTWQDQASIQWSIASNKENNDHNWCQLPIFNRYSDLKMHLLWWVFFYLFLY